MGRNEERARDMRGIYPAPSRLPPSIWQGGDHRASGGVMSLEFRNPSWDGAPAFRFLVPDGLDPALLTLHVLIRARRLLGDRDIGEVRIAVRELEPDGPAGADSAPRFVSYAVRRPSGRAKGVLNLSVKFGERVAAPAPYVPCPPKGAEPVTAYPAPPGVAYPPPGAYAPAGYAGYPPTHHPYGYGAPPPPAYGYAPPGYVYGYGAAPVVQAQAPGRSNFGMGMGAGLLGGALGGLMLGDMLSDADGGGGFAF
ncbi:hypothetical protein Taro_012447 [Colocasia esculenta]|uniref:Uncharacterized protein n=1 Tax=Colocasia esculenta TaxID=4460 RepID=A0A843U952_COLES|nr:hypothetical protein [Colocasia esculenta]